MKFGLFYEMQHPRPWTEERSEARALSNILDQIVAGDELGYHCAWLVEHHFLEEHSHLSAPECVLAAAAARTQRIRLGHGIVNMLPAVNHPARVAERIATVDLISGGRVEFGTGESATRVEVDGFGVEPEERHDMWLETVRECARMMALTPYPGFEGEFFRMPCRNVVPKPLQRPHPPMWVACTNRKTILMAAQLGLGALTFTIPDPKEAKELVDEYYDIVRSSCRPIGQAINPNIAMVASFMVHEDPEEATRRGLEGYEAFNYGLFRYFVTGKHHPGRTDMWSEFQKMRGRRSFSTEEARRGIGTAESVAAYYREYEEAGVDQIVLLAESGRTQPEHILESMHEFAAGPLQEFEARDLERVRRKERTLTAPIRRTLERQRAEATPFDPNSVPPCKPYRRTKRTETDYQPAR